MREFFGAVAATMLVGWLHYYVSRDRGLDSDDRLGADLVIAFAVGVAYWGLKG